MKRTLFALALTLFASQAYAAAHVLTIHPDASPDVRPGRGPSKSRTYNFHGPALYGWEVQRRCTDCRRHANSYYACRAAARPHSENFTEALKSAFKLGNPASEEPRHGGSVFRPLQTEEPFP